MYRCLDASAGYVMSSPESVSCLVIACCVLHNLAIRNGQELDLLEEVIAEAPIEGDDDDLLDRDHHRQRMHIRGLQAREEIVDGYFQIN